MTRWTYRRHPLPWRHRRHLALLVAAMGGAGSSLAPGTASFVSSGPGGISVSATDATGGTAPYAYQWQRNASGGAYSNLPNGGGVSGATTRSLVDGSAVAGTLYGYQLVYMDAALNSVPSNAVTAQVYNGGSVGGGGSGGPRIGSPLIRG